MKIESYDYPVDLAQACDTPAKIDDLLAHVILLNNIRITDYDMARRFVLLELIVNHNKPAELVVAWLLLNSFRQGV